VNCALQTIPASGARCTGRTLPCAGVPPPPGTRCAGAVHSVPQPGSPLRTIENLQSQVTSKSRWQVSLSLARRYFRAKIPLSPVPLYNMMGLFTAPVRNFGSKNVGTGYSRWTGSVVRFFCPRLAPPRTPAKTSPWFASCGILHRTLLCRIAPLLRSCRSRS